MPRHKSVELYDRDLRIVQMVQAGYALQVVAGQFGITRARVSQIVSKFHEEVTDDGTRDVLRSQLESYLTDTLHPIIRGPGQPMYSTGSGKLVLDLDGNIIYDERIKIDAVNSALRVHERIAKLSALDRPKAKEKDESREIAEAMEYLQSLAAEKQELQARVTHYEATVIPLESVQDDEPEDQAPAGEEGEDPRP